MKINKIVLSNFRTYIGDNSIEFGNSTDKNINIIAGKNGFGKTTFLTALIWSFYGKMMAEVEDKYRRDIKSYGGYDNFLVSMLNRDILRSYENQEIETGSFSVEVELTGLIIPSIPCERVNIIRHYSIDNKKEEIEIRIDGQENELTKNVGYDVFINDFILPRDIAKFFFFDAEKIVSLAEAKTKNELRGLSKAYSEVLGIKKYEELKRHLETLLSKLRRNGVDDTEESKIAELEERLEELKGLILLNDKEEERIKNDLERKQKEADQIQEELIRQGNAITLDQLSEFKKDKEQLGKQKADIKARLNKLMDLAPLLIAGKKLNQLKFQLDKENSESKFSQDLLKEELENFSKKIIDKLKKTNLQKETRNIVKEAILEVNKDVSIKQDGTATLLNFSKDQYIKFEALYANLKGDFTKQLDSIVQEDKSNRVLLSSITKKIKEAEARKNNKITDTIRGNRKRIHADIGILNQDLGKILEQTASCKTEQNNVKSMLSAVENKSKLIQTDRGKYEVTKKLLTKINELIQRIKVEKKYALQKSLKLGLSKLMHKKDFIGDVKVNIEGDIMDINLIDFKGNIINKDALSKGEQQLYATALLKALVDESGIKFPVFIDSPLQKFDKFHSENIIQQFYPQISDQVVLLPLLEKELTFSEFELLKPNLNQSFIIKNKVNGSTIEPCDLTQIFKTIQPHVQAN